MSFDYVEPFESHREAVVDFRNRDCWAFCPSLAPLQSHAECISAERALEETPSIGLAAIMAVREGGREKAPAQREYILWEDSSNAFMLPEWNAGKVLNLLRWLRGNPAGKH